MMKGHWVNGYHFFFFFSLFQQNLRLWFTSDCAVSAVRDTFRCIQITTRAMAKSSSSSPFILHFFCVIFLQHKQMTSVSWPLISYTVHTLSPSASASASAQSLLFLLNAISFRPSHLEIWLLIQYVWYTFESDFCNACPSSSGDCRPGFITPPRNPPIFFFFFFFFLFIGSCMVVTFLTHTCAVACSRIKQYLLRKSSDRLFLVSFNSARAEWKKREWKCHVNTLSKADQKHFPNGVARSFIFLLFLYLCVWLFWLVFFFFFFFFFFFLADNSNIWWIAPTEEGRIQSCCCCCWLVSIIGIHTLFYFLSLPPSERERK